MQSLSNIFRIKMSPYPIQCLETNLCWIPFPASSAQRTTIDLNGTVMWDSAEWEILLSVLVSWCCHPRGLWEWVCSPLLSVMAGYSVHPLPLPFLLPPCKEAAKASSRGKAPSLWTSQSPELRHPSLFFRSDAVYGVLLSWHKRSKTTTLCSG